MRRSRLLLATSVAVALVIPPIAAAVTKARRPSVGGPESDEIDIVAIFDELDFASRASAFRGGSVLCWYGGGVLDLTEAALDPAGARLRVVNVFGGMALRVPLDWQVELRARSVFGGAGDARPTAGATGGGPLLIVEAVNAFGGLGIIAPES